MKCEVTLLGITGPATLKYRLEGEMIPKYVVQKQKEDDVWRGKDIVTQIAQILLILI